MATWIKCTRKSDNLPIYLNLDSALYLRWNGDEGFTAVLLPPGGKESILRILEHPDDLVKAKTIRVREEAV